MDLKKKIDSDCVIFSIDVGSANSSVSILYAQAGETAESLRGKVQRVDTWPAHKKRMFEIPTCLCYKNKKPIDGKYGANASRPRRKGEWQFVEAFKRHVNRLGSNDVSDLDRGDFEPFPEGVTLHKIYEDWTRFLFKAGSEFFKTKYGSQVPMTSELWKKRLCVFVAPNGWNEPEQANVRLLLQRAGCVEHERNVRFARESEASLHYCLFHGLSQITSPAELGVLVCNSGAATTDLGFYKVISAKPLHYEEVKPAISFEAGSIVAQEVAAAKDTPTSDNENNNTKDPVDAMIENVGILREGASVHPKYLVLAGGFGRDPEVRQRISNLLSPENITVLNIPNPTTNSNPTVDGALYSCIHNFITARAAPYNYGCVVAVEFDGGLGEHRRRKLYGLHHIGGKSFLPHGWYTIVPLGELINDGDTRRKSFTIHFRDRPRGVHRVDVELYATKDSDPEWVFENHGKSLMPGMQAICKIQGDLNIDEVQVVEKSAGRNGKVYEVHYFIDIDFASVTSQARILWKKGNGTLDWQPADLKPPSDTVDDWQSNDWQDGKTDDAGQSTNEPTPFVHSNQKQYLERGRYTLCNTDRQDGSGYASWDAYGRVKEVFGRDNDRSYQIQWVLESNEARIFSLRPEFGDDGKWNQKGRPYAGFEGQTFAGKHVLSGVQQQNAGKWYATKAAGENEYYIWNISGGLVWSIEDENQPGQTPKVTLRTFDVDDTRQIWRLIRQ